MALPEIDNIELTIVKDDILLVHQKKPPFYFSCCDGLLILPKEGRNSKLIALDVNIEPQYIQKLIDNFGPASDYVCTHGHMDHIAHVHAWEEKGAKIYGPNPEGNNLIDLNYFSKTFGWGEKIEFPVINQFAEKNKYLLCKNVEIFEPGIKLIFENFEVETIHQRGHSEGHVSLYLPNEKILHISCLGFDKPSLEKDGFGPWYGFRQCSIDQYLQDIDFIEEFSERAEYLTSSHAYVVKLPDSMPFDYMRQKFIENQRKVDESIKSLGKIPADTEALIKILLKKDILFPKKRMKGFIVDIYSFWEEGFLRKHIQKSKVIKK